MAEKQIGVVFSYFKNAGVAAVDLSGGLKIGDKIHIKGHTTDFEQEVTEMQIDRKDIKKAGKGDNIGVKVEDRVRPNDKVYLVK